MGTSGLVNKTEVRSGSGVTPTMWMYCPSATCRCSVGMVAVLRICALGCLLCIRSQKAAYFSHLRRSASAHVSSGGTRGVLMPSIDKLTVLNTRSDGWRGQVPKRPGMCESRSREALTVEGNAEVVTEEAV